MAEPPRRHLLTILPGGWQVPVQPSQTLLQAALDGGVRLPRSCRNGSCRSCIARLLGGHMHHSIDWPGLLAEEKAEGWILPCVACADSDLQIHAPGATELLPRAASPC